MSKPEPRPLPPPSIASLRLELKRREEHLEGYSKAFAGTPELADADIENIRDDQAHVGRVIHALVTSGNVKGPSQATPWWEIRAGTFDAMPFDDLSVAGTFFGRAPQRPVNMSKEEMEFHERLSADLGLNVQSDSNAQAIAKILHVFQQSNERHCRPHLSSASLDDFIDQHVCIEAVNGWLREQLPLLGSPVVLSEARWLTEFGDRVSFMLDCIGTVEIPAGARAVGRLAQRCALVCRLLAATSAPEVAPGAQFPAVASPMAGDPADNRAASPGKPLTAAQQAAISNYRWAMGMEPALVTDRDAWDWLKHRPEAIARLPETFETWRRHLSAARAAKNERKHNTRRGRAPGGGIVRPSDIEGLSDEKE